MRDRKNQRELRRQRAIESADDRQGVSIVRLLAAYRKYKKRNALEVGDPEIKDWESKFNFLHKSYWDSLVERDYMPSKEKLLQMDMIDVRNIVKEGEKEGGKILHTLSPDEMAFISENIYHLVPPFMDGCVRVQSHRYYHFGVEEVTDSSVECAILDLSEDSHIWSIEGMCRARIDIEGGKMRTSYRNFMSMPDVLNKIAPPDDWPYNDKLFWNIVVRPMIDKTRRMDTKYFLSLSESFFGFIGIANYYLSQKRPVLTKEERKAGKEAGKAGVIRTEYAILPSAVKRMRTVGPVKFRSEKVPHLMTEETVRTYKTGAWNRRGHVRTYKSGKQIYVHPTTCHRKNFEQEQPGQTIIRVKERIEK